MYRIHSHVAGSLIGEQRHELSHQLPENWRRCFFVAQDRQLVGNQWVVGNVHSHRLESMSTGDVEWMRQALALAAREPHPERPEVPVAALVIDARGEIIASARNEKELRNDPTAHAEMLAIRAATRALNDRVLDTCTLVVTLEPCVMCAGAIAAAHIPRVVFAAWDEKAGAAGSVYDVLRDRRLPNRSEVVAGVLEKESSDLLRDFFSQRRER